MALLVQPKPVVPFRLHRDGRPGLGQIPVGVAEVAMAAIGLIHCFDPADGRLVIHGAITVDLCETKRLPGGQVCIREPRDLSDGVVYGGFAWIGLQVVA